MRATIRTRGRPAVDTEELRARFPRDLLDALDRFVAEEHPGTLRPEALRIAFRDWAIGHGYLPNPPTKEGAN
jgi:hypothetical protein